MEDRLDLIVLQNWVLIGLLLFVLVMSVSCAIMNARARPPTDSRQETLDRPNFAGLWDADDIDTLLTKTEAHLVTHKNSSDALYFRAKALRRIGRDSEAKECFVRLMDIEPSLRSSVEHELEALGIDQRE